jgi:hypothetical protein
MRRGQGQALRGANGGAAGRQAASARCTRGAGRARWSQSRSSSTTKTWPAGWRACASRCCRPTSSTPTWCSARRRPARRLRSGLVAPPQQPLAQEVCTQGLCTQGRTPDWRAAAGRAAEHVQGAAAQRERRGALAQQPRRRPGAARRARPCAARRARPRGLLRGRAGDADAQRVLRPRCAAGANEIAALLWRSGFHLPPGEPAFTVGNSCFYKIYESPPSRVHVCCSQAGPVAPAADGPGVPAGRQPGPRDISGPLQEPRRHAQHGARLARPEAQHRPLVSAGAGAR